MLKWFFLNLSFVIVAIFLTLLTPWFREVDVFKNKKADLVNVACGWPFGFVNQNLNRYDPPYSYKIRCSFISLEDPTKYSWHYFAVDVVFFYIVLVLPFHIVRKLRRKTT